MVKWKVIKTRIHHFVVLINLNLYRHEDKQKLFKQLNLSLIDIQSITFTNWKKGEQIEQPLLSLHQLGPQSASSYSICCLLVLLSFLFVCVCVFLLVVWQRIIIQNEQSKALYHGHIWIYKIPLFFYHLIKLLFE